MWSGVSGSVGVAHGRHTCVTVLTFIPELLGFTVLLDWSSRSIWDRFTRNRGETSLAPETHSKQRGMPRRGRWDYRPAAGERVEAAEAAEWGRPTAGVFAGGLGWSKGGYAAGAMVKAGGGEFRHLEILGSNLYGLEKPWTALEGLLDSNHERNWRQYCWPELSGQQSPIFKFLDSRGSSFSRLGLILLHFPYPPSSRPLPLSNRAPNPPHHRPLYPTQPPPPSSPLYCVFSTFPPQECMVDHDVDHGFVFDQQGRTDILRSPFFDDYFSQDDVTADDYLDRILYQLTLAVEERIRPSRWVIIGRRPPPPSPTTFPSTTFLGLPFLVVVSCLGNILLVDVGVDERRFATLDLPRIANSGRSSLGQSLAREMLFTKSACLICASPAYGPTIIFDTESAILTVTSPFATPGGMKRASLTSSGRRAANDETRQPAAMGLPGVQISFDLIHWIERTKPISLSSSRLTRACPGRISDR
ncbi:hypothetical protein M5K25_025814 [Dendrobium thyrsiflorum]|uniref:Uncharacterized protein n=1 Tax=Dendrobium thyrsiflorum TaxID=117978 RepID=A0ABD0UA33_DENTH